MDPMREVRMEGVHCELGVRRPAPGVVVVTFAGLDVGEFGDAPFRELAKDLAGPEPIELFIDARSGRAASIEVSHEWAQWLRANRARLRRVSMLSASRFIQLSADLVARFAEMGELMRLYTDAAAFDEALAGAVTTRH